MKKKRTSQVKNLSKLSIIYGLQTSLDFDKALEIANNLFQLYEYCRHEIIRGFSQKFKDGILKAIDVINQTMEGWENTISREIKMDSINSDLICWKICQKNFDLIYYNNFNQIEEIDTQRKVLIKKSWKVRKKNKIKERIRKLIKTIHP